MVSFTILFILTSLLATTSVAQAIYDQDVCVKTFAGNYNNGKGSYQDGPKNKALFFSIFGIAIDSDNNLLVGDTGNNRIRIIYTNGTVSTLAGTGDSEATDSTYKKSSFISIGNIRISPDTQNIYVCDQQTIRVLSKGMVKTIAGLAENPVGFYKNGYDKSAGFSCNGLTMYKGDLYFGDQYGYVIRKVDATGYVSTITGRHLVDQNGYSAGGYHNGDVKTEAIFNNPTSVVFDSKGRMFVFDDNNYVVRMIEKGTVSTFAGVYQVDQYGYPIRGYRDGPGKQAMFLGLGSMTIDKNDNIYLTDATVVRKINTTGYVTTVAGVYKFDNYGSPVLGYKDGPGSIAQFTAPTDLMMNGTELLVSDFNLVRKITFGKCE